MASARTFSSVLMAIALVVSSVAAAQAGGGAGSQVGAFITDCYVIHNGANSPYVLEVTDQFGTRQVRLQKSRLLCAPATAAEVVRGPELNPDFTGGSGDHIKCYDIVPPVAGPGAIATISDIFGQETVVLDRLAVLCTEALKTLH